mmetsp:Transcript_55874/g.141485  ORF Transcript_55874/g.141485 Transcript_55874/m.141485 type:complete len:149 (+) Transcript_55874:207-653(+)
MALNEWIQKHALENGAQTKARNPPVPDHAVLIKSAHATSKVGKMAVPAPKASRLVPDNGASSSALAASGRMSLAGAAWDVPCLKAPLGNILSLGAGSAASDGKADPLPGAEDSGQTISLNTPRPQNRHCAWRPSAQQPSFPIAQVSSQ